MKFLIPLAIAAITGVSAVTTAATPTVSPVPVPIPEGGDKDCLANYIVKQCLQTESDKVRKTHSTTNKQLPSDRT